MPHRVEGRYPFLLAPTGSCAEPRPSPRLRSPSTGRSSQVVATLLDRGPSRRYPRESVPGCLGPYPGGPLGARAHCFPNGIGLPLWGKRVGVPQQPAQRLQSGAVISGLQPFRYVQASRSACHPGRSYRSDPSITGQPWRFHPSLSCLVTSACPGYACRPNGQLAAGDFHPVRLPVLSAAPPQYGFKASFSDQACPDDPRG